MARLPTEFDDLLRRLPTVWFGAGRIENRFEEGLIVTSLDWAIN